jgi:hypothetical protein
MAANVSRRLARLSDRLGKFDQVVVTVAGTEVHDALLDEAGRATGGDRRLSGMGGRVTMDVQLRPLSNPVGVRITPKPKQAGIWTIVSSGTSAHTVQAKRRKVGRGTKRGSSRARAMRIGDGGGWAVGPWTVGGTRGKDVWPRGVELGLERARAKYRDAFREAVQGG